MRSLLLFAVVGMVALTGCSCIKRKCSTCTAGQLKYTRDADCDDCQVESLDFLAISGNPDQEIYPNTTGGWILTQPYGKTRIRAYSHKPEAETSKNITVTTGQTAAPAVDKGVTIKIAPTDENPITIDTGDAPEVQ